MNVTRHPLSWYVDRLEAGTPTVSLLYGDGEFVAADPDSVGRVMQGEEVVTWMLAKEIRASLDATGPDLVRGSDPSLLDWRTYEGQDVECVRQMSKHAAKAIGNRRLEWADGTVWDAAVREGQLFPLIEWIHRTNHVCVVGNPNMRKRPFPWGPLVRFVPVPKSNAAAKLDDVYYAASAAGASTWLLCCGLSAIPLAMRLRRAWPGCTVLDLGSTLDVFFGLGSERGWRHALYNDAPALNRLLAANLGGLA